MTINEIKLFRTLTRLGTAGRLLGKEVMLTLWLSVPKFQRFSELPSIGIGWYRHGMPIVGYDNAQRDRKGNYFSTPINQLPSGNQTLQRKMYHLSVIFLIKPLFSAGIFQPAIPWGSNDFPSLCDMVVTHQSLAVTACPHNQAWAAVPLIAICLPT